MQNSPVIDVLLRIVFIIERKNRKHGTLLECYVCFNKYHFLSIIVYFTDMSTANSATKGPCTPKRQRKYPSPMKTRSKSRRSE